jgi:RNA polymerase sigma factor (sigma-70 family)
MSDDSTVHIVDDDASIRDALRTLLEASGYTVETYGSAHEFLEKFRSTDRCCLILDVCIPGMTGLELQEKLRTLHAGLPVIFMTAFGDVPMAVAAMKAGATDFVEKPFDATRMMSAVRTALERAAESGQQKGQLEQLRSRLETLSPREREVLALVVSGNSTKEIGRILQTSYNTVQNQRASILRKLGADSSVDLVRMVMLLGDISYLKPPTGSES